MVLPTRLMAQPGKPHERASDVLRVTSTAFVLRIASIELAASEESHRVVSIAEMSVRGHA